LEHRILIVDDEEMICSILDRRLTQEGYSCVTAHNGREALHQFLSMDHLSLIVSDIKMPEMDGMELFKQVKAVDPGMMVIMMTGYPEIDMAVEVMRMGANDFLIKPVDLDLVVLSVKKALEKKRLEEEIEAYHQHLESLVEKRTSKLQEAYQVLKKANLDSVNVLAGAIEAKDPYTRGHSDRVRKMSLNIGRRLDFSQERLENLEYGALLHDIGKIGIKDEVLLKQGLLNSQEYQYIQEHPLIGARIIAGIDFFKEKIPMIRHHHEHFDGSGYPDGLVGEAIPIEARIISIADAYDAMTSRRPQRRALPLQEVLLQLEMGKATQFDPDILEIFLSEKIYQSSETDHLFGRFSPLFAEK